MYQRILITLAALVAAALPAWAGGIATPSLSGLQHRQSHAVIPFETGNYLASTGFAATETGGDIKAGTYLATLRMDGILLAFEGNQLTEQTGRFSKNRVTGGLYEPGWVSIVYTYDDDSLTGTRRFSNTVGLVGGNNDLKVGVIGSRNNTGGETWGYGVGILVPDRFRWEGYGLASYDGTSTLVFESHSVVELKVKNIVLGWNTGFAMPFGSGSFGRTEEYYISFEPDKSGLVFGMTWLEKPTDPNYGIGKSLGVGIKF